MYPPHDILITTKGNRKPERLKSLAPRKPQLVSSQGMHLDTTAASGNPPPSKNGYKNFPGTPQM
jgi:hypothetical protein